MKSILLLVSIFSFYQFSSAQNKIIKANSKTVSIRDGDIFKKNTWTISPEIKPDVYETSNLGKKVTFYTDIDSISIKITNKTQYDFIIVLNDSIKAPTQIKYKPSYLDILKKASKFNSNDTRKIPVFEYQDKENPNLVALRKGFKLDSIAGKGNQTLKILNLLHWVHDLIPHDGNHENPVVKNAMSMINQCKKEERGLNCRGLATVLNECYLSLGFKSRFVTCMSKDSVFNDCHVINMVYLDEQKKWIWVDPTNDAYVMNENGELLGIEEVRKNLINNKPLILNPDANWNNRSSTTKENYLYQYMAKNLYRFSCPLVSEYDSETRLKGKEIVYVELLPLDGFQQKPDKDEYFSNTNNTKVITYKTNNPNIFWKVP